MVISYLKHLLLIRLCYLAKLSVGVHTSRIAFVKFLSAYMLLSISLRLGASGGLSREQQMNATAALSASASKMASLPVLQANQDPYGT